MIDKENLREVLSDYFDIGDSYAYNLTRVKEGSVLSVEDFVEFDEDVVDDIVNYVIKRMG